MIRMCYSKESNPKFGGYAFEDKYDHSVSSNDPDAFKLVYKAPYIKPIFLTLDNYISEVQNEIKREDLKNRIMDANENLGEPVTSYQNVPVNRRELKSILNEVYNRNNRSDTSTQTTTSDLFNLYDKKRKNEFNSDKANGDDLYRNTWINMSKNSSTTTPKSTIRSRSASDSTGSSSKTVVSPSVESRFPGGIIGIFNNNPSPTRVIRRPEEPDIKPRMVPSSSSSSSITPEEQARMMNTMFLPKKPRTPKKK